RRRRLEQDRVAAAEVGALGRHPAERAPDRVELGGGAVAGGALLGDRDEAGAVCREHGLLGGHVPDSGDPGGTGGTVVGTPCGVGAVTGVHTRNTGPGAARATPA